MTILIADDDTSIIVALKLRLNREGMTSEVCQTPDALLARIAGKKFPARADRYQLRQGHNFGQRRPRTYQQHPQARRTYTDCCDDGLGHDFPCR